MDIAAATPATPRVKLTDAQSRRVTIYSRMGLWGLTLGLLPPIYYLLEGPRLPWSVFGSAAISGLGFLVGGFGALGASILVSRRLKGLFRPLKAATFIGMPFGLSTMILGFLLLGEAWLPSWWFLGTVLDWTVFTSFFLGLALAVLLIGSFVIEARARR